MSHFSKRSKKRLATCDERLQKILRFVITYFDCSIVEGYRDEEKQNEAFGAGNTQLKYPHSKHNIKFDGIPCSKAVDAIPYPIDWTDIKRIYYFAGFVIATAKAMDISLRWGGDWDRDTEVLDNKFNDLCHFELD
jgi:peptidoglycan L-alanyl-D-glutamate endopeptidase CwlK